MTRWSRESVSLIRSSSSPYLRANSPGRRDQARRTQDGPFGAAGRAEARRGALLFPEACAVVYGLLPLTCASGIGSGGQGGGDLRGVLGAAEVADFAVAELEVVVHVHRDVLAGRGDGERVADEEQHVALVVAGVGQRGEFGDRTGLADAREEAGDLVLAVPRAVPRGRRDGRVGGPVDVVGDPVQDGLDITAAERLVQLPGGLDVLLGGHGRGAGGHGALLCWIGGDCLPRTVSSGNRPQLSTVQSILAAAAGPVLAARPCRMANIARPALVETPHLA